MPGETSLSDAMTSAVFVTPSPNMSPASQGLARSAAAVVPVWNKSDGHCNRLHENPATAGKKQPLSG